MMALAFGPGSVVLICGVVTFVFFKLLPLVFRRVNPVYSAHTIERQAPAMKNSLVKNKSKHWSRNATTDAGRFSMHRTM